MKRGVLSFIRGAVGGITGVPAVESKLNKNVKREQSYTQKPLMTMQDEILSKEERFKKNSGNYENEHWIKYQMTQEIRVDERKKRFMETHNLFDNISEVAIMLSNLCNYALIHKKCPANCVKEKEIMPSKLVYKILDELAQSEFDGTICFHIYNEPLIDPRLFLFIQYAKKVMPKCLVEIYSNGYYLNSVMLNELREIGMDILVTTGYGKNEYERLIDLNTDMPFHVSLGSLDDRLDYYTEKNTTQVTSNSICNTYLSQVPIFSNGDIGTCCLDYKHPYSLGNVIDNSLEECLNHEKVINFQLGLLKGDRTIFPICSNCNWNR